MIIKPEKLLIAIGGTYAIAGWSVSGDETECMAIYRRAGNIGKWALEQVRGSFSIVDPSTGDVKNKHNALFAQISENAVRLLEDLNNDQAHKWGGKIIEHNNG